MDIEDQGSVTRWVGALKTGDDSAARHIWERYYERLVRLARGKLRSLPHLRAADEEDVALDAFDGLYRGAVAGKFPELSTRDDLWRLLVVITMRKALNQSLYERAQSRGGGIVEGESGLCGKNADETGHGFDRFSSGGPTPELAAMMAQEHAEFRDRLTDESLRKVLDMRLENYSREEIAKELGCSVRSVNRKLLLIRQEWIKASNDCEKS